LFFFFPSRRPCFSRGPNHSAAQFNTQLAQLPPLSLSKKLPPLSLSRSPTALPHMSAPPSTSSCLPSPWLHRNSSTRHRFPPALPPLPSTEHDLQCSVEHSRRCLLSHSKRHPPKVHHHSWSCTTEHCHSRLFPSPLYPIKGEPEPLHPRGKDAYPRESESSQEEE
jgi:hypothetical protein